MPAVSPGRASYGWLIITLAAAAGLYAWYAFGQYNGLNDLNQRQLSNASAELKAAINSAVVTVEEFNRRWEESDEANRPRICDFVRSQPYLELGDCTASGRADQVRWIVSTGVQAVSGPKLEIEVAGAAGEKRRFQYRTDKLLEELAFPDSFALIFVATEAGDVLYQDAPTRRQWLRHLRWDETAFRDTQADRPPTLQIHNIQQLLGGDAAWKPLRSVSSRTTVTLGATAHELYLQPLTLDGPQPINLVIGGAVPRASISRDALALGAPLLGVLVFVLLFALLGFPFVKLACLDLHERFTLRDIKLLYVSAGALLVLFTCASLAVDGYVRWDVEADRGLDRLAEHIQSQFLGELIAIRAQLKKYDDAVKEMPVVACEAWLGDTNWFAGEGHARLPWPADLNLRTVAWIEPGGRQIWKSTADPVPGKFQVSQRAYFRAVRDDYLFTIEGTGPPIFIGPDRSIADGKFYTFVAMRSGIDNTRCADTEALGGTPVVAATAQLLSLDRLPLPAGYGFALVNREGRVLYHSDGRLSLRENLYEELSDGAQARAMIYAGHSGPLNTRYRERPHTFLLRPIRLERAGEQGAGTRFYLAVFRDTSVEQALVGHVFVVGLVAPMALLLALSGAGLLLLTRASRRTGRRWSVWLWPHRGLDHVYKRQTAAFLVLLMVSAGLYLLYGTIIPFLVSSVLAPVVGVLVYWHFGRQQGPRASLIAPVWQQSSVLLVLVCMVVVPSAALFRLALSHEFAKLILTERNWIEAQKDDRLRATRVEALEDRYATSRTAQLLDARRKYAACVPPPFDAGDELLPVAWDAHRPDVLPAADGGRSVPAAASGTLVVCAAPAVGARAASAAMLQPMGMATRAIEALGWVDAMLPLENDVLARQHFQAFEETYSPEGTIVPSFRASGIALAGFAITLGLLAWWVRWNTNRVFLADLDASLNTVPDTCDQIWADCSADAKMVLLQLVRERIANPYQRQIIVGLLNKGVLQLRPDLQPFSSEFEVFLEAKADECHAEVEQWEAVTVRHSWRYGRLILVSSVAGVGFFLVATQPGLQSSVMAIATGITGVLTAGSKLRDALTTWLARKGTT